MFPHNTTFMDFWQKQWSFHNNEWIKLIWHDWFFDLWQNCCQDLIILLFFLLCLVSLSSEKPEKYIQNTGETNHKFMTMGLPWPSTIVSFMTDGMKCVIWYLCALNILSVTISKEWKVEREQALNNCVTPANWLMSSAWQQGILHCRKEKHTAAEICCRAGSTDTPNKMRTLLKSWFILLIQFKKCNSYTLAQDTLSGIFHSFVSDCDDLGFMKNLNSVSEK